MYPSYDVQWKPSSRDVPLKTRKREAGSYSWCPSPSPSSFFAIFVRQESKRHQLQLATSRTFSVFQFRSRSRLRSLRSHSRASGPFVQMKPPVPFAPTSSAFQSLETALSASFSAKESHEDRQNFYHTPLLPSKLL